MASFFFKCIPCGRRGKASISEDYELSRAQPLCTRNFSEPVEAQLYSAAVQRTPLVVRARGFEEIHIGTTGSENGITTDTKTRK